MNFLIKKDSFSKMTYTIVEPINLPALPEGFYWKFSISDTNAKSIEIRRPRLHFWSKRVISTPLDRLEEDKILQQEQILEAATYIYNAFILNHNAQLALAAAKNEIQPATG
jgi:hypothetical protein